MRLFVKIAPRILGIQAAHCIFKVYPENPRRLQIQTRVADIRKDAGPIFIMDLP